MKINFRHNRLDENTFSLVFTPIRRAAVAVAVAVGGAVGGAVAGAVAVAVAMAMAMCEWRWPRGESGRTRQRTPVRAAEQPAGA